MTASNRPAALIAARIAMLPARGFIGKLIATIALGGCFEFYDMFLTAYIAPSLIRSHIFVLHTESFFDIHGIAAFVAALFAGMFVGAGLLGGLADRFGRRAVFYWSLLIYSACTFIMALQTTPEWVVFWRFLAMVGVGLEQVVIDTYVSEFVPASKRGRAFGLTQAICFTAVPVVAVLSWILVPHTILGLDGWRIVTIIGSLGALIVWFVRRWMPESPIWLEKVGRHGEAEQTMAEIERSAGVAAASRAGAPASLDVQNGPVGAPSPELSFSARWRLMWSAPLRGLLIVMCIFNVCVTVGYYGFASWVPTLLVAKGMTVTKSLEYSVIMALAAPLAPLLSMLVADRMERKWQVCLTCAMCAVLGCLFGAASSAAVVMLLGFLLTLNNGWMSSCYHTYQAEVFPSVVRGQAVGFVYCWSRFAGIFCSFIVAWLLGLYGPLGVFVFITANMLVIVVLIGWFGPRTNHDSNDVNVQGLAYEAKIAMNR
ncbi:MFS transporter [Candidimonas nitroreducens]|uniref:MFS transporter n=1 Tax=Candidimonas nitroreducens TaxID=683354 RepID=A0A225MIC6_9BURK|nr:MFS transporter [Candidimonas nitroreducens]OWT59261.1 MFS transporter [Candidimonas nitroreducens]